MGTTPTAAPSSGDDAELRALDGLAATIEDNVRDERVLVDEIRHMRAERASGRSWHDLLGHQARPTALAMSARILGRATEISATLRRRLARGLRAEGATIPAIGETFGVSHQRVSTLLRDGDANGGPSPT